jgi:uncharacterized protein (DUF433 family)
MRIRVSDVIELLANGLTQDDILIEYPYLEKEDIQAALVYSISRIDHPVIKVA